MAFTSVTTAKFFWEDTGAALQDISSYVTEVNGLPGKKELVDITTFGALGHRWGYGLWNGEFTVSLIYSEDATYGAPFIFTTAVNSTSNRGFQYWPNGTTGKSISGDAFIDDYNNVGKVGDYVRTTLHCKVDNNVTVAS